MNSLKLVEVRTWVNNNYLPHDVLWTAYVAAFWTLGEGPFTNGLSHNLISGVAQEIAFGLTFSSTRFTNG